jgi:hypothetical protein
VDGVTGRRAGAAAWAVPVLALLAAIATGALWVGAGLVSLATGNGWPAVALTPSLLVDLARSGGPAGLWPALDPTVVVAAAVVLAVLLLAPAALVGRRLWRHRPGRAGPVPGPARRRRPDARRPRRGQSTGAAAHARLPGHMSHGEGLD